MSQVSSKGTTIAPGTYIQTLSGDTGGAVSADGAGNINIPGSHGINTDGNPGLNTVTIALDNAITLGDLAPIGAGSGAVTLTTGDLIVTAGNIQMPNTNAGGTQGVIKYGGSNFIHNYGFSGNVFVGDTNGNTSTAINSAANVGIGNQVLVALNNGQYNVGIGSLALNDLTSGSGNTAVGAPGLLQAITGGNYNTAVGFNVLPALSGNTEFNTSVGAFSSTGLTTGSRNTILGYNTLPSGQTCSNNIIIGVESGYVYTTSESSNILINNQGVIAENNTIRIGTQGSGTAQQDRNFQAGIAGVSVSNQLNVVIDSTTGQLGTTTPHVITGYVVANATPYVVGATAYYITVDSSTIPITIQLPNAPTQYRTFVIKDSAGNCNVNNITVTTVGGVLNIDATPTFLMNSNYQSIQLIYSGFGYEVY